MPQYKPTRYDDRGAMHQSRAPQVVAVVRPDLLEQGAAMVVARMRRAFRRSGGKCYLFVDHAGNAWVVHETQSCLQSWLKERFGDFVACYGVNAGERAVSLPPDLEGVIEDLREHLSAP